MASTSVAIAIRLVLIVSIIGLWLTVHPETAHACSCMPPGSPSEELGEAGAVFLGRAISETVTRDEETDWDILIAEFSVATVWKGPVSQTMRIGLGGYGTSCQYSLVEGEEYIVYAHFSEHREGLWTGLCTRTIELSRGMEDLAELGEGQPPAEGTNTSMWESAESGEGERSAEGTDTSTREPAESNEGQRPGEGTDTSTAGGCSRAAGAVDLAFVGLLVGVVWSGLRKRGPDPA